MSTIKRKIKFRLWAAGEMNEVYSLILGGPQPGRVNVKEEGRLGFPLNDTKDDDIFLEQYTNLNDNNDKEIYEGDIVRLWDGSIYEVGCFQGEFCLHNRGAWDKETPSSLRDNFGGVGRCDGAACDNKECIEWGGIVIGNIHENPELLPKKS